MRTRLLFTGLGAALLALTPSLASAYIGPGVAGGAIAAVFGFIGAVFLAIFAVIWYPVKRLLKGKKKPAARTSPATAAAPAPPKSDA